MEYNDENRYSRFNMPFELGIDYACSIFENKNKKILVLEKEQYLSNRVLSDLAGSDFVAHNNNPEDIIKGIRNFFISIYDLKEIKYQAAIMMEFQSSFEFWYKEYLTGLGYPKKYFPMDVSIKEYINAVNKFFEINPSLLIEMPT